MRSRKPARARIIGTIGGIGSPGAPMLPVTTVGGAETLALACCVIEWLNQHPAPSPFGRCAWCGKAESPGAVVLPFGTEPGTHTWLHAACWPGWHKARQADAIAALGAMGIQA